MRYIGFGLRVYDMNIRPDSKGIRYTNRLCVRIMIAQPYYWTDPMKGDFEVEIESIIEANGDCYLNINEQVTKPAAGGQAGDRKSVV